MLVCRAAPERQSTLRNGVARVRSPCLPLPRWLAVPSSVIAPGRITANISEFGSADGRRLPPGLLTKAPMTNWSSGPPNVKPNTKSNWFHGVRLRLWVGNAQCVPVSGLRLALFSGFVYRPLDRGLLWGTRLLPFFFAGALMSSWLLPWRTDLRAALTDSACLRAWLRFSTLVFMAVYSPAQRGRGYYL